VAAALVRYAHGAAHYAQVRYQEAEPDLRASILALRHLGAPAIADWAALLFGGARIAAADYDSAERTLLAVAAQATQRHDLALRSRARWGLALSYGRRARFGDAEASAREALSGFGRLGETSNYGFVQALNADFHFALGRVSAHANTMFTALDALHRRSDPRLRHTVLLALGQRLSDYGYDRAALAAIREAGIVALSTGRVKDAPETLGRLAYEQSKIGDPDAIRSLGLARERASQISDTVMRARLTAEIARAEAVALQQSDPRRSADHLTRAEQYYASAGLPLDRAQTLTRRAAVRLTIGDSTAAEEDLQHATALIRAMGAPLRGRDAVRQLVDTQRDVYRVMVGLAVARHDTLAAFRYASALRADTIAGDVADAGWPRAEPGEVTLEYLTVGDRVLIWALSARGHGLVMSPVPGSDIRSAAQRFVNLIRLEGDTAARRELSRRLYDALVAPVSEQLSGAHRVVVVTDRDLSDVPFAALRDSMGTYLITRYAFRYAGRAPDRGRAIGELSTQSPLLVGDPAWDRSLFPDLESLRSAAAEVRSLEALYRQPRVLAGGAATRASFLRELRRHDLVHFAGHAVVVSENPGASQLVLARDGSAFNANVVFAREIAQLDLRSVRLVVLSACGESRALGERSVGRENGLVQAFLDAGAGGVIASQWEADDDGTMVFMQDVYGALSRRVPADEALRRAQVTSLRSERIEKVWAAFRLIVE
jgi:CHAT domain-containing protein